MPLLVRKIDRAKWPKDEDLCKGRIPADAVTCCLKTRGNSLSTWSIENEAEITKALLAIVTNHDKLETIDIIWINEDDLRSQMIKMESTQGNTRFDCMKDNHVELTDLDYDTLGIISSIIIKCIAKSKYSRWTRSMLKKELSSAIDSGKLSKEQLSNSLIAEITKG